MDFPNIKSPCMGCENRVLGCHSTCDLYLQFDAKRKELLAKKREYNNKNAAFMDYREHLSRRR